VRCYVCTSSNADSTACADVAGTREHLTQKHVSCGALRAVQFVQPHNRPSGMFQGFEVCSHLLQMVCFCDNNWWPGIGCRSVPTAADGGDPLDFPLPLACPFDSLFIAQVLQRSAHRCADISASLRLQAAALLLELGQVFTW
jgi:hypothetical protein